MYAFPSVYLPTIRTLALVSGSTSHIRDITRRYSTQTYIQSVGIQRDFEEMSRRKRELPWAPCSFGSGAVEEGEVEVAPSVTGQLVARWDGMKTDGRYAVDSTVNVQ